MLSLSCLALVALYDSDVHCYCYLQAGVARTTIRTGDVPRGISLAQSSENPGLQRECAAILEVCAVGMHQVSWKA